MENLQLASLLQNIGKFQQRSDSNLEPPLSKEFKSFYEDFDDFNKYLLWSAEFIKQQYSDFETANMTLFSKDPEKSNFPDFSRIIQIAEKHSFSNKMKKKNKKDIFKTPLVSICSEISFKKKNKIKEYYVPLKELDLDYGLENLKPISKNEILQVDLSEEYKHLWNKFTSEFDDLNNKNDFNTVLSLLEKYTSSMPFTMYEYLPDISLYNHSKTTAALAVCRYLFEKSFNESEEDANSDAGIDNQEAYLTINGDISGIQKFIFKIASPKDAQSGMSKRLRGRSLYLTLLTDAIVSRIVQNLNLTSANILFCGGGRFTILAPNTPLAKDELNKIKKEINSYFISEFNAELYLAIATEECSGNDFSNFGSILSKLSDKLAEDKKHKFSDDLKSIFTIEKDVKDKTTCSVCGNLCDEGDLDDKTLCPSCNKHEDLGRDVTNADFMMKCIFKNDVDDKKLSFYNPKLKIGYAFFKSIKRSKEGNVEDLVHQINSFIKYFDDDVIKFELIRLNNTDFLKLKVKEEFLKIDKLLKNPKISYSFSFIGNTVPSFPEKGLLYFEHLAQISNGSNKLAVLKMDVDDLGLIFSRGLNAYPKKSGISRVSTLSTQLDLFFSGLINNIAKEFNVYHDIGSLDLEDEELEKILIPKVLDFSQEDKGKVIVYKDIGLSEEQKELLKDYVIPTIYIDYSGGDDLLVIGPYDDIIKFSRKLREDFKKWTACNEAINLSAGVNIISPKFPIGKAVEISEQYLDVSKSCGKDKITVFNETVSWEGKESYSAGFNELLDFGDKLEKYYYSKGTGVSKSFIYSLLHMWKYSYKDDLKLVEDKDDWIENMCLRKNTRRYVPLFKYKLRLIDKDIRDDLNRDVLKYMPWIRIPVSWVSLRTR